MQPQTVAQLTSCDTPRTATVPAAFSVTAVCSTAPNHTLCKQLRYDPSAKEVIARTSAHLSQGTATIREFAGLGEFIAFRRGLAKHEALMMGVPPFPEAKIVTQAVLSGITPERRRNEKLIARDRAHVSWAEGPALVMLDLDRPDEFPPEIRSVAPTTPDGWRDLLVDLIPGLKEVPMAWAPSSSSNLWVGEDELRGIRGQRFYFTIASGVETPRFAEALHDALVLEGLFWVWITKSGNRRVRLPFDSAVFHPEHLDFAAGPDCQPPLEWRPAEPLLWNERGKPLAAPQIPGTTRRQQAQVRTLIDQKRRASATEARAVKEQWIEETERAIGLRANVPPSQATRAARAAVELGRLLPDFLLTDSEGTQVTVGELLADPEGNHGRRFHDPLEPDYRRDPRIAVFLAREGGEAVIYSHAHGGQRWRCTSRIPTVRVGRLHETVDEIRAALEEETCGLYRSAGRIVSVSERDGVIQPMDAWGLALRLQRHFDVLSPNRGTWTPSDLKLNPLKALASETPDLAIPPLRAVVRGPYAHRDGTVVDTPGYDWVSEILYLSDSPHPPTVRRNVSIDEARDALLRLWHPVSKFPFETALDRGVILAALLTAVVRPGLTIVPGYSLTAHAAGTGKTLLAHTIGALATGKFVATTSLPRHDEEIRKHVFATMRNGGRFLLYDNAERGTEIDSPALANLVTSPVVEGRVLGVSTVEQWPNQLLVVITGNNIALRGDLNRRFLPVRIDAEVEHPWERQFDFDPVAHVRANWLSLRIAALELIQAWLVHGAPPASGATGFPEWDHLVRGPLRWIAEVLDPVFGIEDPSHALREAYADDPESETLGDLLEAWYELVGDREVQVRDLEDRVARVESLGWVPHPRGTVSADLSPERKFEQARRTALGDRHGSADGTRQLGRYLHKHAGRISRCLRLNKGGRSGGARRWSVTRVKEGDDTGWLDGLGG